MLLFNQTRQSVESRMRVCCSIDKHSKLNKQDDQLSFIKENKIERFQSWQDFLSLP